MQRSADFPGIQQTTDWVWRGQPATGYHEPHWIGTDSQGVEWLVKGRGGYCGYRERAFSLFAQLVGVSVQSSQYVRLDRNCPARQSTGRGSTFDAGILLVPRHGPDACAPACPIPAWSRTIEDPSLGHFDAHLSGGLRNRNDYVYSQALASICGANEGGEYIVTADHCYLIIDNEQMFSMPPNAFEPDLANHPIAWNTTLELCSRIAELADSDLRDCAFLPKGYAIGHGHKLLGNLEAVRQAAQSQIVLRSPAAANGG